MLPNAAKQLINNIRSIVESDGLHVPVDYLNEGMRSLMYNLPIESSIAKCLETASMAVQEDKGGREAPFKNNSLAIYTPRQLAKYDAALSFFRLLELELVPLPATFDADHLQKIHKVLFSDLFGNAGELRRHNARLRGNEFITAKDVPSRLDSLTALISNEKNVDLSKNDVARRIGLFMHELYLIHPFPDGNGRVSRVFFRQYADSIGYRFNYNNVSGITMRGAEMLAFQSDDVRPLNILIEKCLSPF